MPREAKLDSTRGSRALADFVPLWWPPPCSKLLHLCVPYSGEDLVWHPVTKQMNSPAFQVWVLAERWLG